VPRESVITRLESGRLYSYNVGSCPIP